MHGLDNGEIEIVVRNRVVGEAGIAALSHTDGVAPVSGWGLGDGVWVYKGRLVLMFLGCLYLKSRANIQLSCILLISSCIPIRALFETQS